MSSTTAGALGAVAVVLGLQALFMTCSRGSSGRTLPARHQRRSLHLARRAQHAVSGLFICAIHQICHDRIRAGGGQKILLTPHTGSLLLLFFAGIFFATHRARLRFPSLNRALVRVMKNILRKEEASGEKIPASFWFLLGTAAVMRAFPTHGGHIFRLALLVLSFGDPAAGLIGSLYGRTPWFGASGKTVEGSVGCALVCAMVAALYFFLESEYFGHVFFRGSNEDQFESSMWHVSGFVGVIGALSELVKVPYLDDNFTMPIFAAGGLWFVHSFFVPWAQ